MAFTLLLFDSGGLSFNNGNALSLKRNQTSNREKLNLNEQILRLFTKKKSARPLLEYSQRSFFSIYLFSFVLSDCCVILVCFNSNRKNKQTNQHAPYTGVFPGSTTMISWRSLYLSARCLNMASTWSAPVAYMQKQG